MSATDENADVHLSAGEFQLSGKEIRKEPNETFEVKDGTLTTCQCDEGKDCPAAEAHRGCGGVDWEGILCNQGMKWRIQKLTKPRAKC